MKYLISGATGFLGKSLLNFLPGESTGLARSDDPSVTQLDLLDDDQVKEFIKTHQDQVFDSFLHCAAVTPWAETPDFTQDEILSKNVVAICKGLHVKQLIFMSGWIVYDLNNRVPFKEDSALGPHTPYGKSKLQQENFFVSSLNNTTTKVVNARLSSVYGPGQTTPGLITNLTRAALKEKIITLNALHTKRDYIYIQDLVAAIKNISERAQDTPSAINIGSGSAYSVEEVANCIKHAAEKITGEKVIVRHAEELAESLPSNNQLDITLLSKLYPPASTPIEQGIEAYVRWAWETL